MHDTALDAHGIPSTEATVRQAQLQFNRWLALEDTDRRPARLMDMLGFDYFKLLDLLTIARSRKHIERYYGTQEMGRFPERLKPINIKPDVEATLARIESHAESVDEIDIDEIDVDDPAFESLLVGRKVKVLLQDVDRIRWRQDLIEDRNRLATLPAAAKEVGAARDAKLAALRETICTTRSLRGHSARSACTPR